MGTSFPHLKGKDRWLTEAKARSAAYREAKRKRRVIERRRPRERNEPAYLGMDSCEAR